MTSSGDVVGHMPFLGRQARLGSWEELAVGTFRAARARLAAGDGAAAAELLAVAVLEAEELHDVYGRWPAEVLRWLEALDSPRGALDAELARLRTVVGDEAMDGFEDGWTEYVRRTEDASDASRAGDPRATLMVEDTRAHWQHVHDLAVDRLYGLLDVAVRLAGEDRLREVWDLLMADWYDAHEQRLDLENQPWAESARQLRFAILDGFHAHLTGPGRQGDVELLEDEDRWGFRFAPCGSGGRTLTEDPDRPALPGPPYGFAVTTEKHDWAWNTVGICAYCVHCCLLNELVPIERLGYPTRVIDPPVWPSDGADPRCTWWVYKDPRRVPDDVFRRVGRERAPSGIDSHEQRSEEKQ